jgi:predicted  nucleic acid-binding Zn-ribbon protein
MKILFALLVSCLLACASATRAAEPSKESERDQQQIAALTKELQSQQKLIAENQTKIDEKLAAIAEALRQARIYSTRAR